MYTCTCFTFSQSQEIRECVLDPLGMLLELFHDPLLLMHKRGDKLLDYDSLQHNLEKASEPEKIEVLREQVTLAKRYVHVCKCTVPDFIKFTYYDENYT